MPRISQSSKVLILAALSLFSSIQAATITCLTQSSSNTLSALVDCLNGLTVAQNTYDQAGYDAAQPTSAERNSWMTTVKALLDVDGNCTSVSTGDISTSYNVTLFAESAGNRASYCVLHEIETSSSSTFKRGWGTVVVPAVRTNVSRYIHIAAPHPIFDGDTPQQAAALFQASGAKSLLIAGRDRRAFSENTTCIIPSAGNGPYYKTDPAHEIAEPFYNASRMMKQWQDANGGCPSATCAFIQYHGKADTSCTSDTVFLSTGLANSTTSAIWYTGSVDRPVKRVKSALIAAFPSWVVSTPYDSKCSLTATTNVFGRFLNTPAGTSVCDTGATASTTAGQFVHIEQASISRGSSSYSGWTTTLKNAFGTTCAPGHSADPTTKLCV